LERFSRRSVSISETQGRENGATTPPANRRRIASASAVGQTPGVSLPVIVDCDPGHDDAIALVLAARHTNLLGVTTVAGNAPIERTTRNALIVLDLLGSTAPVHRGAARPLLAPPKHAGYVHGESGLDGAALPEPSRSETGDDAAAFIVETVRAHEGVWLVPTGPLTNIALALRRAPDLAGRLAGISLMGGSATVGNRTAVAEFNVWADPEAAAIAFGYGGPLVMAGLHLTHTLQTTPERIKALGEIPNTLGPLLADLLGFFADSYVRRHRGFLGAPVHDACAVLALTHPELFTRRAAHVAVETSGELTRGMTVVDQRALKDVPSPNTDVLMSVDDEVAFEVITDAVASFA
jgi:inosine-uridine nucleoside N-ribohydrolase